MKVCFTNLQWTVKLDDCAFENLNVGKNKKLHCRQVYLRYWKIGIAYSVVILLILLSGDVKNNPGPIENKGGFLPVSISVNWKTKTTECSICHKIITITFEGYPQKWPYSRGKKL